jgi:hypothetical protein
MINDRTAAQPAREYILYACPLGELAGQIERYMAECRAQFGPNQAHAYMPHCTLTGFFHDEPEALQASIETLDAAYRGLPPEHATPILRVREMMLTPEFHGLLLESEALRAMAADFARRAISPTRRDAIRPKDWLHLSLAYGFPPEQHQPLAALACEMVKPYAPVGWSLRFYERHANGEWTCHAEWAL